MLGKMITRAWPLPLLLISTLVIVAKAGDPYLFFDWNVTYGTLSPLGVPQQVILINNQFPGPTLNTTTNNNIVINVFNNIDEPLIFHWYGIQQRKNSWQDGTPGTMCPITPGTNFTYHFQMKDQIGSFMYYPITNFQRASGGFGGIRVHSRDLIPIPFDHPEDDFTVMIGDWYSQSHVDLRKSLDGGNALGKPDGILINGKSGKVGDENEAPQFTMKPGKTYRYRICNVGMKATLNFRIQDHKTLKLVELEGSHTVQNIYDTLDVHLGQCLSVLVTADQKPTDYYMVVSSRFTEYALQSVAKIRYEGGNGPAPTAIPEAPKDVIWSLNQFRSFKWNLTASAARPNPQGSYHYGQINITRTIKLANTAGKANGKLRYAVNGHSHVDPETPIKLAEWYGVGDKVFKYDTIPDQPPAGVDTQENVELGPIVVNATYRNFVEIIFENHENSMQYWHLDGYAFFAVAIEEGEWTPERRKGYNMLDGVSRHSIQVYPKSWAAILLTFDNAGVWNVRSECPERHYLGQQLYVSVLSPPSLRDEYNLPEFQLTSCGIVKDMPKPPPKNT